MAQKSSNRRNALKKLREFFGFSKQLKKKNIFHLINKEEDEDNEQTLWPFGGKVILGRLGLR